jgi:hypothetical protein
MFQNEPKKLFSTQEIDRKIKARIENITPKV